MKRIEVIDSHTGGEPTRLVISGFPDLGNGSMTERRQHLAYAHDAWRAACILEPRGNDVLVGALLCEPVDPSACAGVIFFNNTGYLGMCGHGTIGLVVSLAHMGRIGAGVHKIETPVGTVEATLHEDRSVSVRNVPSYRYRKAVELQVPGCGPVLGDIAWGGNWFFLIADHGQRIAGDNVEALTAYTYAVQKALEEQGIRGEDGGLIDHIELFAEDEQPVPNAASSSAAASLRADSRNFVLCPGKAYDRSPCGTGTSAKLACLAADGKLQPGEIWHQASVIGSLFEGSFEWQGDKVIPTIRGRAHISAEATLLLEQDDPFAWGIRP
ncbi:4-hydroxyproline epimerase [Pseudomonas cuatrocienegasensis]|uniref:4-hydroxyproline epimerase n=1 Tax=Pseudomonas cuatrocienegasensis TaxID=543360 RepID=A0ABY1BP09_9PSED|nr:MULTISPECIES: 4-hydroxyproline epimerase [Pseudomonas]OEC34110.1 hydroxyproline-2-epimerase [Pseudomonas sp. 21C1]SER29325.1 4-hydroxyproline epimerase [Pseudomonas cuatrocienegasensis]